MTEVSKVNNISRTNPFPNIFPARTRSPCPSAMAANGAPPPPTIAEKEEISIMREVVHPYTRQRIGANSRNMPMYIRSTML